MTAKADEPRTLVKVPVSVHKVIKDCAKDRNMTMMDYIENAVALMERKS